MKLRLAYLCWDDDSDVRVMLFEQPEKWRYRYIQCIAYIEVEDGKP